MMDPKPGRRALADISNSPARHLMNGPDIALQNVALLKLIEEKNKMIEMSGMEIKRLRIMLQKAKQQNWQFAQTNSLMLAELNAGKDRLKALQHELGCANAIIKLRDSERQYKVWREGTSNKDIIEDGQRTSSDAAPALVPPSNSDTVVGIYTLNEPQCTGGENEPPKCGKTYRSKLSSTNMVKSQAESCRPTKHTTMEDVNEASQSIPSEPSHQPIKCGKTYRRKSSSISIGKSQAESHGPTKNTTTEDVIDASQSIPDKPSHELKRFSRRSLRLNPGIHDTKIEDVKYDEQLDKKAARKRSLQNPSPVVISMAGEKNVGKDNHGGISELTNVAQTASQRLSLGRPTRQAAAKVVSYKEIPVNVKMRRTE